MSQMLSNRYLNINTYLNVESCSKMINNVNMKPISEIRRENLLALLDKCGSQAAFALKIERSPSYIWQVLNARNLGDKMARLIESKFGLPRNSMDSPDVLAPKKLTVMAEPIRELADDSEIDADHEVMIEEVEVPLSAGPGCVVDFVETGKYHLPFQKRWLQKWGAKPNDVKLFRVDGYSMEPLLFDGDRVAVNIAHKDLKSGHVYAFLLNGETKIKRLFRLADGSIRIVCANTDKEQFPDEIIKPEQANEVFVMLGRVIDKSGSGGL